MYQVRMPEEHAQGFNKSVFKKISSYDSLIASGGYS